VDSGRECCGQDAALHPSPGRRTTAIAGATSGVAAWLQGAPKVMSERLGHATVAFTLDTYTSALPAMDSPPPDVVAGLILGTEEVRGPRPAR
jgi:hypothetical protein